MRSLVFSFVIGAACAGVALAASQSSPSPQNLRQPTGKYSVPIKGNLSPVSGALLDTTLTFSHPVQLPRVKLPAGTYVFTLVSSSTMRVLTADRSKIITTFSTVSVTRTDDIEPGLVRFEPTSGGAGPKVIALFSENASIGYQPIYPSARKQANAPVATTGTRP